MLINKFAVLINKFNEDDIMKKKIFTSLFIIIYPWLLLISMVYYQSLNNQIGKFEINIFQIIGFFLIYFFVFAAFIFLFFIKKESFYKVALIIGLMEIILIQVPQILLKVSYNIFLVIYGQMPYNIFIFGTLLTLYIVMFFTNKANIKKIT